METIKQAPTTSLLFWTCVPSCNMCVYMYHLRSGYMSSYRYVTVRYRSQTVRDRCPYCLGTNRKSYAESSHLSSHMTLDDHKLTMSRSSVFRHQVARCGHTFKLASTIVMRIHRQVCFAFLFLTNKRLTLVYCMRSVP